MRNMDGAAHECNSRKERMVALRTIQMRVLKRRVRPPTAAPYGSAAHRTDGGIRG